MKPVEINCLRMASALSLSILLATLQMSLDLSESDLLCQGRGCLVVLTTILFQLISLSQCSTTCKNIFSFKGNKDIWKIYFIFLQFPKTKINQSYI